MHGSARRQRRRGRARAPLTTLAAGVLLALCAAGLLACGGATSGGGTGGASGGTPPTATVTAPAEPSAGASVSPSATPTTATETMRLSVYFLRPVMSVKAGQAVAEGPFVATAHRWVPATKAAAAAALRALFLGPVARERAIGMRSALPAGTSLRSVALADGTATVDLAMSASPGGRRVALDRLAQVVYTVTQFPTVKAVRFLLDGKPIDSYGGVDLSKPVGRADFEAVTPPILVESPAPFDTVTSALRVSGTADVFEATFQARLVTGTGAHLARKTVTASSGSGTRGTFSFSMPFATTAGTVSLSVWEVSMEDGSTLHEATIPLTVGG